MITDRFPHWPGSTTLPILTPHTAFVCTDTCFDTLFLFIDAHVYATLSLIISSAITSFSPWRGFWRAETFLIHCSVFIFSPGQEVYAFPIVLLFWTFFLVFSFFILPRDACGHRDSARDSLKIVCAVGPPRARVFVCAPLSFLPTLSLPTSPTFPHIYDEIQCMRIDFSDSPFHYFSFVYLCDVCFCVAVFVNTYSPNNRKWKLQLWELGQKRQRQSSCLVSKQGFHGFPPIADSDQSYFRQFQFHLTTYHPVIFLQNKIRFFSVILFSYLFISLNRAFFSQSHDFWKIPFSFAISAKFSGKYKIRLPESVSFPFSCTSTTQIIPS